MLAYIGIGSNLENPVFQVKQAIEALSHLPDSTFISASSLYASKPQGPQDQPDFINAVVAIETTLSATALLSILQNIEIEQGKVKKRHWGERLIDLDILLYGALRVENADLTIPHPEMQQRDFVLLPLQELVDEVAILGKVSDLISQLDETFVYRLNP